MTDDSAGPTTGAELSADLQALFRRAHNNGVDVRGGWPCRSSRGYPDWDIVVTEVEKLESAE
jgi:hypothetical protein